MIDVVADECVTFSACSLKEPVMSAVDNVRDQALKLDEPERATLARDLLVSLESVEPDEDAPSAWATEIQARSDAVASGEFSATDWRESVERVREHLAKRPRP